MKCVANPLSLLSLSLTQTSMAWVGQVLESAWTVSITARKNVVWSSKCPDEAHHGCGLACLYAPIDAVVVRDIVAELESSARYGHN